MYKIPEWISTRNYKNLSDDSYVRSYISNERTHEFIVLDNLSAELWALILEGSSEAEIKTFSEKNNLSLEEINEFYDELVQADILLKDFSSSKIEMNPIFQAVEQNENNGSI